MAIGHTSTHASNRPYTSGTTFHYDQIQLTYRLIYHQQVLLHQPSPHHLQRRYPSHHPITMLSARAIRLLHTHQTRLPNFTRLYRQTHPPHPPRRPLKHLPPSPSSPAPTAPAPSPGTTVAKVGLFSGTMGAMCGVGGAVFAIPGLVRFTSLSQRVAAGNSLVAVTAIASTTAFSFAGASHIDIPVAASLGLSSAIATPIAAYCSRYVSPHALRKGLGLFMLLLAPIMPLRDLLERQRHMYTSSSSDDVPSDRRPFLVSMGLLVGMTSGMLGISGGSLFTPLIAMTYPEASFKSVLGTSFAAMILPTAVGAATYARMGLITPRLLPPLVVGAVGGAAIGSTIALAIPEHVLRCVFAAVFSILGIRILRAPINPATSATAKAANLSGQIAGRRTPMPAP